MARWRSFFKRKKNPQHDLDDFIQALREQAGNRFKSIILFGSMASGEFEESHSDINILVVMESITISTLESLSPALQAWSRRGHTSPVLLAEGELAAFARSMPIEFLDILDHHRILVGEDVLRNFSVDSQNLRAQCEEQVALMLLKLRQAVALSGRDDAKIRNLLLHAVPSILTLCRAVLRLKEKVEKINKIEAAERLAGLIGIDPGELRQLQEFHFSRRTDNLRDFLGHGLMDVEKIYEYLLKS